MKRILSALLALCLALCLAVPALADMETELAEITLLVKNTLEIDDDYTDFSGDYDDGLEPGWSLYWSDDDRSLSVSCKADGTVTSLYRWEDSSDYDWFYGFDPVFPALGREEAQEQAAYWLDRLLADGESARIDSCTASISGGYYWVSGCILLNGLESPVTFSLRIGESGLLYYTRSDAYSGYVGGIPAAEAAVGEDAAAEGLAGAVELELYYVTDADSGQARLTYVPVGAYTVVDAATGEAVDMDALYDAFNASPYEYGIAAMAVDSTAAAEDAGGYTRSLTEAELSSIANYGDVMTQEELDGALRAVAALGLEDFSLQRCSYAMDSQTGDVTAALRYTAAMTEEKLYGYSQSEYEDYAAWGDELTIYKYINVNAKTGELLSVSTSYPLWEKDGSVQLDGTARREAAEGFLSQAAPAMFGQSGLCDLKGYGEGDGDTYVRLCGGYYFPENYLYVKINPAEGTVDAYSRAWDEDVAFAASTGIVDEAAALAAYTDALTVTLGYVAWPESVERDDPLFQAYRDWGYTWVESLCLAWYYSGTDAISGVDALTGEALTEEAGDGEYVYDDLEGVAQKEQIEALAEAGIGFSGGSFQPEAALTQRDAVTLLLQAAGYSPESWSDELLQSEAVWQGFITEAEWSPEETVSRMAFIRMLLGASRYGDAAELPGLWADEDAGYAALAAALGMVSGGDAGLDESCTRAEAAEMLYAFMSR